MQGAVTTRRTGIVRALVALAWIAALAALAWLVPQRLVLSTDLRLFMPTPETPAQRLLLEEIGEGPGSRLLLVALEGGSPAALAAASRALAAELRRDPAFHFVANGESDLAAIPESLLAYRYLVTPTLDAHRYDRAYLARELDRRVQDLGSPAASLVEAWLPRDPTLEVLKLAEAWQPKSEPQRIDEVWFDRAGMRALLVAETVAAGFDPDGQRAALAQLDRAFRAAVGEVGAQAGAAPAAAADAARSTAAARAIRYVVSGPGTFATRIKERTQGEATVLGVLATAGMLVLMLLAYRSPRALVLGALPLASAALAGIAAVSAAFGTVHGITLAFGATLIGVAQDYPIHLLSHQHAGIAPHANARALWPTLATGVASTCIAYLAFLVSGVRGLAQLATFTIAGLAVAGLTTRYLLPILLDPRARDTASLPWTAKLARALERLPHPGWLVPALVAASIAALLAPGPWWENNLAALTPLPRDAVALDTELRRELGAPDARHLLVVRAPTVDEVLLAEESLATTLDAAIADGAIAGYDLLARYVPSAETQRRRRAALPSDAALRADLGAAVEASPFTHDAFDPFLADLAAARALPPLTPATLAGTPLEARAQSLVIVHPGLAIGLVSLTGVGDAAALSAALAARHPEFEWLDLKDAAESLVASYRERILASLAIAAVLLVAVVRLALGRWSRVLRVIAPMAVTSLAAVALLHAAGVPLSLFHLIALVLAAGLGLDYALFFEHAGADPDDHRRTLHALVVCSISTLMVFALLATSTLPVLRAIGVTVSIGVVSNFVLAALFTRRRAAHAG